MCLSYKSFVYIVLYLVRVSRYSSCYLSFFFWRDLGLFFHFFYRLDFEFLALTLLVWSFHSAVFFLWRFCSGLFPLILYIFPHLCYSFWVPLCFLGEWFTIFFPLFLLWSVEFGLFGILPVPALFSVFDWFPCSDPNCQLKYWIIFTLPV